MAACAVAGHEVGVGQDLLGPGEGVERRDLDEQQPDHAGDEGLEVEVDVGVEHRAAMACARMRPRSDLAARPGVEMPMRSSMSWSRPR